MNNKIIPLLGSMFILFTILSFSVIAESFPPNQFWGTITVNNISAPDGLTVSARIEGIEYATAVTQDEKYGYEPLFKVPADDLSTPEKEGGEDGDTVVFYINGIKTNENATFSGGDRTELNLTAALPICSDGTYTGMCSNTQPKYCDTGALIDMCQECGCPGGQSCSGDGTCYTPTDGGPPGGYTPPSCTEDWTCSEWSDCVDGEQTMVCTDQNDCGTTSDKPEETRGCVIEEEEPEKICIASVRVCAGNDLMECSDDETEWDRVETCEFGCSEGKCNTEPESISVTTSGDFLGGLTGYLTGNAAVGLYGLLIFVMIVMGLLFYWKLR